MKKFVISLIALAVASIGLFFGADMLKSSADTIVLESKFQGCYVDSSAKWLAETHLNTVVDSCYTASTVLIILAGVAFVILGAVMVMTAMHYVIDSEE